jgi:hypothetical protein
VVKSSENENKVIAVTLKRPCKSGRNHGKVHENGRGEVLAAVRGISWKPPLLFWFTTYIGPSACTR